MNLPAGLDRRSMLIGGSALGASILFGKPARATALPSAKSTTRPDAVYSYGHSFSMNNYPYAPGHEYAKKVGVALGVPSTLRGRTGTRMLDTIRAIIAPRFEGSTSRLWAVGSGNGNHVVMLENVHNDQASVAGGSEAYKAGYGLALQLALGVFGSRKQIMASSAVKSGSWRTSAQPERAPGGVMTYSKEFRAAMSFTVSGDTCHIATLACDSDYLAYGTMRMAVNGTTVGYYNGTGKMKKYTDSVDDVTIVKWSPAGIRIKGMNAVAGTSGNKTLSIHKSANDGRPIWVNAVYLTSGTPPDVYVALEPPRNPEATDQGAVDNFYANDADYRAQIKRICAQYNYVTCVDLGPGWDNKTMVATGPDKYNFHPNARGMTHIAGTFVTAIRNG